LRATDTQNCPKLQTTGTKELKTTFGETFGRLSQERVSSDVTTSVQSYDDTLLETTTVEGINGFLPFHVL
jgi:hypothetical protein